MSAKSKKNSGMTLVEIMVATAIVAVMFSGIITALIFANKSINVSFVRTIASIYASSKMEEVLSYAYEDDSYDPSDPNTLLSQHDFTGIDPDDYRNATYSGVWSDDLSTFQFALSEDKLGWRRYQSTTGGSVDNPYPPGGSLQLFENYLGLERNEINNLDIGPTDIRFSVTESEYSSLINDVPYLLHADDVDDFDGAQITITDVLADMDFTMTIAVRARYKGTTGTYSYTDPLPPVGTGNTYTISINYLDDMGVISPARFSSLAGITTSEAVRMACDFYNMTYFKEIIITVSWEYPKGSGQMHYYTIFGGKPSPR
jgi:prepilin-type N-terminal cleavage/methylation domain-containing protein